jgi:DNA-binding NtrC family response regulator
VANILLIDDDPDLSDFLRRYLEEGGHRVECLDRAERGPGLLDTGDFDLVLLDNKMPGMSGIDFLQARNERAADVPVILMTGYSTTDTAIQAVDLGAFDYVIKPDDFQSLCQELGPLIAAALRGPQPAREVRGATETATADSPMLVGKSKPMLAVYRLIGRFAKSNDAVLIRGETGTGKELVARAIHTYSPRKGQPFVALNCAALPESLLESELFGHVKGAYTGAEAARAGKFACADGGTLFLDEIGDMPLPLQGKLLRVLETQEVEPVGGNRAVKVNVRVLSATHRDLEAAIAEGTFRRDLFFRLNRVTIPVPPLRERQDDLPELAAYFLARAARATGRPAPALAETTLKKLCAYAWPGNIRELQNVMHWAAGVCRGPQILPEHLNCPEEKTGLTEALAPQSEDEDAASALRRAIRRAWDSGQGELWPRLRELLESELLKFALAELGGNQTQAAERLGMNRGTLINRMQQYRLK